MRVLYVSNVVPEQNTGGAIIALRHLQDLNARGSIISVVVPHTSGARSVPFAEKQVALPARRWWWPPFRCEPAWFATARCVAWRREASRAGLGPEDADVIVTICWGPLSWLAAHLAKTWRRPLITIVHDLWTELESPEATAIGLHTCGASARILAVSEEMRATLAAETSVPVEVMYPVPARCTRGFVGWNEAFATRPVIAHIGTLHLYHVNFFARLGAALAARGGRLLVICPRNSAVLAALRDRISNLWHQESFPENHSALEFVASHATAAAVMYPREAVVRQRTGFPSRLVELSQLGLPILACATQGNPLRNWAERKAWSAQADPDDNPAFTSIVEQLCLRNAWEMLAAETRREAEGEFSPERIHHRFAASLSAQPRHNPDAGQSSSAPK